MKRTVKIDTKTYYYLTKNLIILSYHIFHIILTNVYQEVSTEKVIEKGNVYKDKERLQPNSKS